jgi:peptide/nickel transport system ATP-binding protein
MIYEHPEMPYTLGLLSSIPRMDKEVTGRLEPIKGNPPSPIRLPPGCVFEPRCPYSELTGGLAKTTRPELLATGSGPDHLVRCHLPPEKRREISDEVLGKLRSVKA